MRTNDVPKPPKNSAAIAVAPQRSRASRDASRDGIIGRDDVRSRCTNAASITIATAIGAEHDR